MAWPDIAHLFSENKAQQLFTNTVRHIFKKKSLSPICTIIFTVVGWLLTLTQYGTSRLFNITVRRYFYGSWLAFVIESTVYRIFHFTVRRYFYGSWLAA